MWCTIFSWRTSSKKYKKAGKELQIFFCLLKTFFYVLLELNTQFLSAFVRNAPKTVSLLVSLFLLHQFSNWSINARKKIFFCGEKCSTEMKMLFKSSFLWERKRMWVIKDSSWKIICVHMFFQDQQKNSSRHISIIFFATNFYFYPSLD